VSRVQIPSGPFTIEENIMSVIINLTVIEKIIIVFVLTFLYGLERQRSHKPIGLGAFVLVATGSCALTLVAVQLSLTISLPLLSAIVTGIGFLGAGALMGGNASERNYGFTTAASVWLFAIFGVIMGLGIYDIAGVIYLLVWIVVFFDRLLEKKFMNSYKRELGITTKGFVDKKEITNILSKYCTSFKLIKVEMGRGKKGVLVKYLIEGLRKDIDSILKEFYDKKWCISVSLN
jgi:putative Mg2+ transporter-C (MgtC) family protein